MFELLLQFHSSLAILDHRNFVVVEHFGGQIYVYGSQLKTFCHEISTRVAL